MTPAQRDAHLQQLFDCWEAADRLEVMADERAALADAAACGHLGALVRLVNRALVTGAGTATVEERAAADRRWVRRERTAAEEAVADRADAFTPAQAGEWELSEDGIGLAHRPCGARLTAIDPAQAAEVRDAHTARCLAGRREVRHAG